jgi:hypothetical protein
MRDLRTDAEVMQSIHFSVNDFLNSSLRLEYSSLACRKMPIKLEHADNETRPQSSQQLKIRFGMLSNQNQSPPQGNRPTSISYKNPLGQSETP